MYCPQCGQERISEATSFCSRCGYLLTGTAELLKTGGSRAAASSGELRSPRSRGIRTGIFMFLLMFVLAPAVGLISTFGLGIEPWPVGLVIALFGVGGLLRIVYALMFESKAPVPFAEGRETGRLNPASANFSTSALPPQRDMPAAEYASPRTGVPVDAESREAASVTDNTTKLLEKDPDASP